MQEDRWLKQRLNDLEKPQAWLAEQLGITEGAISRYINGYTTPKKSLKRKVVDVLGVPYQTLDKLLE